MGGRYRTIEIEAFSEAQRAHVLRVPTGYVAFVPPALPPRLPLGEQLVAALSRADRAIGELAGAGAWLPNPHLLIQPFLRREAVLSSRIEGTIATVSDVALFEASPQAAGPSDAREVVGYVQALELGLNPHRELPISLRLLRELHRVLLTGVRGQHLTPGEFRTSQNWLGGRNPTEAVFVPPPVDEMKGCLDSFEKYLHADDELPPLIRLALIHYQFEAIHPFLDGNGRIGRLLLSLLLHEWTLLPQPLLYLSAFFEANRNQYYDHLLAVSHRGEWVAWVTFFLVGVQTQSVDALARAHRLFQLRESYHAVFQTSRSSALLSKLVDRLFERPAITVSQAQHHLGISYRAASQNVDKLVTAGILREATGQPRNRVFIADGILDLLRYEPARGTVANPAQPGHSQRPETR
jgi:Fic family protein